MKLTLRKMMACLGLVSCLCLTTSDVHAILASIKTTGMAATGIAYPQDAEAGAFNPAGMVDVGDRFDVGFSVARDSRKLRIRGNAAPVGVNGKFDANHHAKFAYNGDFGINKQIGCNMSIGLVVYNRNYNKTKYKHRLPLFGTSKVGMEYVHETISPTFAIKILDKHNFGVSINWMIQRLWVQGIQNFANARFSAFPTHVTNHRYAYSQGCGFTLGYRGQISDTFSIGVTYQPKTHMSRFHRYKGFLVRGKLDIPTKIGAGIAWRFLCNATLAFDVEYINWKRIKSLHNPLQENLPDLIAHKLGTNHGSGFGFRDQWYYRVGIDYDILDCVTIRAGYRHTNTPIRRSQTAVNALTVDTVEDFITLGATWCINACNEVSVLYAHGFNNKVRGKKSIPEVGFGGGNADLKQYTDVVGISWGHTY